MTVRRVAPMLGIPLLLMMSSCAAAEDASPGSGDLNWLWGLIGVFALFALGGIAYKIRNPTKPRNPTAPHAPEGRIIVQRGKSRLKNSGPYDDGPRVPDDPSHVPKFHHHWDGS